MKAAPWKLFPDRERWTVKSWNETEGEDIQLRRAKLLKEILDNVTINILPFDQVVGRLTPTVIGCATAIDVSGDYIPDLWNDDGQIGMSLDASVALEKDELEILRTSVRTFAGKTAPEMTYKAWHELVGDWARDAEAAKLKDPTLDTAIFGQVTSTLNWEKILRVGLRGYINEAKANIDRFIADQRKDVDCVYFWRASIIVLEAAINHAHRYAALAREMAEKETDAKRKAELIKIADTCDYVPENPARTFQEALQSMAICGVCKDFEHPNHNNPQWGRADQYLYPYFMKDINEGVITVDRAAELMADLIGRWGTQCFVTTASSKESHQINFGINNIMVGGVDKNGEDVCNELSYLILHVVGLLAISAPTVGLKWTKKTPEWMMRKSIQTNIETKGGIPLFENDDKVVQHFVRDGIPYEEAVDWCGLGCVYPCLPTRAEHYGAEGVAAFNLGAIMHMVLHNGVDINGKQTGLKTGDPRDFKCFEDMYQAFLKQHKFLCHRIFWLGNVALQVEPKYMRLPFLSSISIQACMDKGQDLLIPDPDYAMFGVTDRAIIDAADSMMAVKKLVFEDKKLTMDELMNALDSNFAGERGEEIRMLCLRQPKYGNDIPEIDELVRRLSDDSGEIIHSYDNSPYRRYMVAREGLAWHYYGGLGAGALPDGRKALEPLNDGSLSPMRGVDKHGPTAVLRSAITAGFDDSYASVLNQKFSSAILASPDSVDKLIDYTDAFMSEGGTHIQYNIVDTAQLKDAKAHPENYSDLIVRIGGFSAYFTQLSPSIQDDVINRSEFNL
jgi:formate C-acetyltransferase